ncbi:MAG: hypothetical protein HUJ54_13075, partial [Erysipelotrichaceae bacterium]|nr:hypothetical protein [Erysipelotrichaceae bacterium]
MNRKFLSAVLAFCLAFPFAHSLPLAAREPSDPSKEGQSSEVKDPEDQVPALIGEEAEPAEYTFTVTSTKGGKVDPPGETKVPTGYGIGIKFTADEGYYLADYYVDGNLNSHSLPYANPYSLSYHEIDRDHTVHAVFKKKNPADYVITASCSEGGQITPEGENAVKECEDMTFKFAPTEGYIIKDVKVDGESKGSDLNQYTFNYVEDNHAIEVEFAKAEYTITASAGEGGKITPEGAVTVKNGESQSFEFTADLGYAVQDVKVDGESKGPGLSTYNFEAVDADHTIEVEFAKAEFTITASASEGGKITPEGTVMVKEGESQSFEFAAEKGYALKDVKVDGESKGAGLTEYKFDSVESDHTIEAEFEKTEFTIQVSSTEGGTISPDKDVAVKKDGEQNFEIKANTGYEISDVKVDGVSKGKITSYKFEKVNADHTISVTFAKTAAAATTSTKTSIPATASQTDLVLWSCLAAAAAAGPA